MCHNCPPNVQKMWNDGINATYHNSFDPRSTPPIRTSVSQPNYPTPWDSTPWFSHDRPQHSHSGLEKGAAMGLLGYFLTRWFG